MATTGPYYATAAADDAAHGGTAVWGSTGNISASDGAFVTATLGAFGSSTHKLNVTGFNFDIPTTAIIDGIFFEFQRQGTNAADNSIQLLKGGVATGNLRFNQTWPSAEAWANFGGVADLWGTTWTVADINASNFGVAISAWNATSPSASGTASIDTVRMTISWHTSPTDVPKREIYKVYDNTGSYLGNIPSVISKLDYSLDINTVGSQITVDIAESADTSYLTGTILETEAGLPLETELSVSLETESTAPLVGIGTGSAMLKNGNRVVVWEYGYYYPNGRIAFSGVIEKWAASIGSDGEDLINVLVYSDGADMDNLLVRGLPFTYTLDQSQAAQNGSIALSHPGGYYVTAGQSFTGGVGVPNITAISVLLNGIATVTVQLFSSSSHSSNNLLASSTLDVNTGGNPAEVQFGFPTAIGGTIAGRQFFFYVTVDSGQSILIYKSSANPYAGGTMYDSTYTSIPGSDLYFKTYSGVGSTTNTFTSLDPTFGMLVPIIQDYWVQGGSITAATLSSTSLSLTYTFNTSTVYEALNTLLSLCPNGYYYYVNVANNTLYFLQASTIADITLTKGVHIEKLILAASIENIINKFYFSGGATAGVNLYRVYQDSTSSGLYGPRIERRSDNRVTLTATADAIGNSAIAKSKDEQYQTTVTVLDKTMDITTLLPGKIIGLRGYGTFVDSILMQIVRVEYKSDFVKLTLGILPKRLQPEIEKITRELLAQQTLANPTTPS